MAVRFDGTSGEDFRRTANLPAFSAFTACGWARLSVDTNFYSTIRALQSAGDYVILTTNSDGTSLTLYDTGGSTATIATLTVGQWFFWAVVGSSATNRVAYYALPGATSLTASGTLSANLSSTPNRMSLGDDSFGEPWNGGIERVRVWDAALSTAELLQEMNRTAPARYSNLNIFSPMIASTVALSATDYSGNGRNWTANGTLAVEHGAPVSWGARPIIVPFAAGAPSGDMTATASLSFASSAALTGTGALAGSAALTFAPTGALTGTGAIAGSSAITFTPSATAQAIAAASGTAAMSFSPAGSMVGDGALAGTSALSFAPIGALTGIGDIAAQSQLVFTPSGTLTAANQGDISGAASMAFAATGVLTGEGALSANAQMTFTASATAEQPADTSAKQKGAGKSKAKRKKYIVEIDGEDFRVESPTEAQRLLDRAREVAEEAVELVKEVPKKARPNLKSPRIRVRGEGEDLQAIVSIVAKTRDDIRRLYRDASRTAEIAALLRKQLEDDEEDAITVLLM